MIVPGKGAQLVGQKRRLCDDRFGKQGWARSVCFWVHFPPHGTNMRPTTKGEKGNAQRRPFWIQGQSAPVPP